MDDADWDAGFARAVGVFLNGGAIPGRDDRGQPIVDGSFFVLLNGHHEALEWTVPGQCGIRWTVGLETAPSPDDPKRDAVEAGRPFSVAGRSMVVLELADD